MNDIVFATIEYLKKQCNIGWVWYFNASRQLYYNSTSTVTGVNGNGINTRESGIISKLIMKKHDGSSTNLSELPKVHNKVW